MSFLRRAQPWLMSLAGATMCLTVAAQRGWLWGLVVFLAPAPFFLAIHCGWKGFNGWTVWRANRQQVHARQERVR